MSPVCKMADSGRLTVDQMVKVVLFHAETKSVVATQRRFRARFGTRWAPCKQTIYRLSLGTIFQSVRINSVPDIKCFYNNKNVLCTISSITILAPPCIIRKYLLYVIKGCHRCRHLRFRPELLVIYTANRRHIVFRYRQRR